MSHVCDTCSGTRFEAVDGYFYCLECGTQSQNQQVEMEAEPNVILDGERAICGDVVRLKKAEGKSNEGRITSWEEYNYILVGLVDEMISLGANNRFKKCVLKIWTRYLQTIEAAFFSLEDESLPRLPVNYRKRDAEILYNKHHRKRPKIRRGSCSSVESAETKSSTGMANSVIKSFNISKILKKAKQELARAHFEDFKKLDHDSSSVATSLATASQQTSEDGPLSLNLGFTRNARRVMKRKMKMDKNHIRKHETDHEDVLDCHREKLKPKRADKLEALDSSVLLGIICLALNLTQDPMQCSDVIRFLREGHLSYHDIRHFLPENVKTEGHSNFESLTRRGVFNHLAMRKICGKLFRDTTIPQLIRPDIVALVHRYVDELQLPVELKIYLEKMIAYHPPRMELTQEDVVMLSSRTPAPLIPNYEGRAMSYIILVLKMFFGLDDNREVKISNSAREINKQLPANGELHLFVVEDWLKMLKIRQFVVEKHHLPSAIRQPWKDLGSMSRGVGNWKMYVDHIKTMYESKLTDRIPGMSSDRAGATVAHNTMLLLSGVSQRNRAALNGGRSSKLTEESLDDKSFNFQPSLTPYRDYAKALMEENSKLRPLLQGNTEAHLSEDFSLSSLQVFYGDRIITKRLAETLKQTRSLTLQVRELGLDTMNLKIVASDRFEKAAKLPSGMVSVEIVTEEEAEQLLECKTGLKETLVEVHVPMKESDTPLKRQDIRLNISNMDYWQHYTCYREKWLPFGTEALAEEKRILPNNFQFLISECARIIEQDPRYLLLELALLEKVLFLDRQGLDKPKSYMQPPNISMW